MLPRGCCYLVGQVRVHGHTSTEVARLNSLHFVKRARCVLVLVWRKPFVVDHDGADFGRASLVLRRGLTVAINLMHLEFSFIELSSIFVF